MDEEPNNNSNGIVDPVNPVEPEAPVNAPEDAAPAAGETASGTAAKAPSTLTGEKVLDIALGVAVIAGEALDKAAQRFAERTKEMQEQSPAFWDTAEERGRPVREKLVSTLRGASTSVSVPEGAAAAPDASTSGLADSLRNLGRDIGLSVGGGSARVSAEDEIRSLEDRVRELEQVVVSGKTGIEPEQPEQPEQAAQPESTDSAETPKSPEITDTSDTTDSHAMVQTEAPISENDTEAAPQAADTAPEPSPAPTTAESFSYAFGEDQHEDFLAASPYAVSETGDERAVEASGSVDAVEGIPQGEVAPPEGEVTPPPSSGRSSRKKQRDFEPEATDDNAPSPSPEA
ncbi:MAG: hypothetical protein V4671_05130 [Armatimonadota bacterium]